MKTSLAIICSILMVWLAKDTLFTCFGTHGCGTPCAWSVGSFLFAPVPLTLPFSGLLWAKELSRLDLSPVAPSLAQLLFGP